MSIEDKLKEIAGQKFPAFSYVFDSWDGVDVKVGRVSLPAIVTILPVGGNLNFRNGRLRDNENCAVAFIDKVPRDADGDENERVYTAMKDVAGQFIQELNKSGFFEPIEGDVPYYTIYESMADNVTGVFLDLRLKEVIGKCGV
jgi:hypothetical protein